MAISDSSKFTDDFLLATFLEVYNAERWRGIPLGLIRETGDLYMSTLFVPALILEMKGNYYEQKGATLGVQLRVRKEGNEQQIKVMELPRVLNEGYLHPLVWKGGLISYGSYNLEKDLGLRINEWFNNDRPKRTADMIANMLLRGKMVLEPCRMLMEGRYNPYRDIGNYCPVIAHGRGEAEAFALKNGIGLERII
ncbi:MAG TPA: hypothetical protein VJI46_07800 [Candidatus Nanoarchaeia archaeon]|nr:hypothetical protein [Candidatus Nanoarchaeia archaeon]